MSITKAHSSASSRASARTSRGAISELLAVLKGLRAENLPLGHTPIGLVLLSAGCERTVASNDERGVVRSTMAVAVDCRPAARPV